MRKSGCQTGQLPAARGMIFVSLSYVLAWALLLGTAHRLVRDKSCVGQAEGEGGGRGFTLIELVIVLLIMGIMLALAAPKWTQVLQTIRVSNAASRIVADLARAQAAAYNSSSSRTVTFTVGSHQYQVSGVTALNRSAGPYLVKLTQAPYQSQLVTVWGQLGTQTITFNGYGLPDKGGNIVVAAGNLQKTIVVDPVTGTAVIQ